jgi:hypothetical protein
MSARDRTVSKVNLLAAPRTVSDPATRREPRDWRDLLAVVLLVLFWVLAVSASRQNSATSDELPHLTAGYAYDWFGDYRLHSENGVLPQRLFGLPPRLLGAQFPTDETQWSNSNVWQLGWDFFYGLNNPLDRMLFWARALNGLFGVALGGFIYMVARRWHGVNGGLIALGFYALCPNFLAHSALATSDVAAALFLTVAPWLFWTHLEKRSLASGALAGLAIGAALAAKFNGLLLAPVCALLVGLDALGRAGAGQRGARLGHNLRLCLLPVATAVFVLWALFGFRYTMAAPGRPPLEANLWPWDGMLHALGAKAAPIEFARTWHLLPEAWLYGLTNVLAGAAARPAFFAGQYRLQGWWEFFPVMFLVKTTLALLVALGATYLVAVFHWRKAGPAAQRARLLELAPLAVTALVVAVTAIAGHLNIGHRHILAVYPVLFIAVGALGRLPRRWLLVPLGLLAGQAVESLAIRPHYLAFFNTASGGPDRAYRLVVDSSLDWGQDLPALRDWVATNRRPGEPLLLSYFGNAWPPHYGVRPNRFLPAAYIARPPFASYDYVPGLYAVSATCLAEVYTSYAGPWRAEWEALYRTVARDSEEFDRLRFARLCKYLQRRTPDANAGHSILIFRLSADDLHAALEGPVKGW